MHSHQYKPQRLRGQYVRYLLQSGTKQPKEGVSQVQFIWWLSRVRQMKC